MDSETLSGTMSLPRGNKKPNSTATDLAVFALVLGFVAYSTHYFYFQTVSPPAPPEFGPPPSRPAPKPGAAPASAPNPATAGQHANFAAHVHGIGASEHKNRRFFRLLQIQWQLCDKGKMAVGEWQARNMKTGEEIIIFVNEKERSFATSFFTIEEGANPIQLSRKLGNAPAKLVSIEVRKD